MILWGQINEINNIALFVDRLIWLKIYFLFLFKKSQTFSKSTLKSKYELSIPFQEEEVNQENELGVIHEISEHDLTNIKPSKTTPDISPCPSLKNES